MFTYQIPIIAGNVVKTWKGNAKDSQDAIETAKAWALTLPIGSDFKIGTITQSAYEPTNKELFDHLCNLLLGEKIPLDIYTILEGDLLGSEVIIPANYRITKTLIRKLIKHKNNFEIDPSPIRNRMRDIFAGKF